jgi:hypothetical protein
VSTVRIFVTQEDIDLAWRKVRGRFTVFEYGVQCPVGRAANRALGKRVWVTETLIMADPKFPEVVATLPAVAMDAVATFDYDVCSAIANTQLKPFEFEIEVSE